MASVAVEYPNTRNISQTATAEENKTRYRKKVHELELQPSREEHAAETPGRVAGTTRLDKGYLQHGCSHYRRRCHIRAPCCDEIFSCRHCHNEAKTSISIDQKLRHDIPRHSVEKVICSLCDTEQEVGKVCKSCGVCMGRYFCGICKLFDDDTSKEQYHCDGCGICRIGGSSNFFHCNKCGCCYSTLLKSSHPCVERAMHQDCPVCFEDLSWKTNSLGVRNTRKSTQ